MARVDLEAGDDRVLYEHEMREVPLVSLAQKGSLGKLGIFAAVGQYGSGLGPRGILQISVGPEWESPHWLFGGELQFSRGDEKHGGLVIGKSLIPY